MEMPTDKEAEVSNNETTKYISFNSKTYYYPFMFVVYLQIVKNVSIIILNLALCFHTTKG
jgi:uncharacterized membrane protein